ncbi:uncharacterized protein N7496_010150 [Penicillium cataractarum]|uniref:SET domain-containing protein n=1 Tax=Penicillium cataractarum TaxID=2100454 RepID=A0A9W9V0L8_9EURO|nr:uncharacterized protein N7496_010150 [Penicillium cataractarum]KAJ5364437.1 hypothetical protein N7496_010150 [Penicillium cataractarum]
MDTHDVSNVPEYFQHLQLQKKNLKNAQAVKGCPARPQKSRDEILMQFMFRQMMNPETPADPKHIRSSFLPPAYPPCVTPFSKLKKVMIKNLYLETHHREQYLLLRTVTRTDTITAVMAIVEDEDGSVLMIQLYNQEQELSGPQSLREGTVLVVKEPYVKVMADGDYGIRVDHLSDVRFIPEFDELVPLCWRKRVTQADENASFWKAKGNEHFNQGDHQSAIQRYSKCLETRSSPELQVTVQLNRSLSFLKSYCFDAALRDVEDVLSISELSEKALFRKGQALYQLRRFKESCETFALLTEKYPDNTQAAHEYARASSRLVEQESGKYEFRKMILEAKKRQPPRLDRGTYIGPVAVKQTQSHGRGLFTTQAVKAGDLLFCEKAFAHAFHGEDSPKGLRLLLNVDMDKATIGTQVELIELIVQKLYKNPSLLPDFVNLHHGTYKSVDYLQGGFTVVDTFLVERIILLNGFGCPLLSHESHIHSMKGDYGSAKKANERFHSSGVWSMASYINHSCLSNARRSFIGDMMIVRASRDLPPNTEITFWYKSPMTDDPKESPVNLQHWGFKCDCILCQDTRSLSKDVRSNRNKLLADLRRLFKRPKMNLPKIEDTISTLAGTYHRPASEIPRLELDSPYLSLAAIYASSGKHEKAVKFGIKSLESLGFVIKGGDIPHISDAPLVVQKWGLMTDAVVACWMILCNAFRELAPTLASQAEGYARVSYKICVGEDETFDRTYSRLSNRVDGFLTTSK